MFSSISGVSLSEYIRRRRLTLAAFEIQKGDIRIIDGAIEYGHEARTCYKHMAGKLSTGCGGLTVSFISVA